MLQVNDLRKGFGFGSRRIEVLKGIDLEIEQGELVALMGPSGCGKSTLLNIIGGLLAGDSGMVKLNDFTYGTRQPSGNVKIRRHGVGWIFQDFHLVDHLTALDNVALALGLSGLSDTEANIRALKALERVGLGDRVDHIPDQLSADNAQRVAIARAVADDDLFCLPTNLLEISIHVLERKFCNFSMISVMILRIPFLFSW